MEAVTGVAGDSPAAVVADGVLASGSAVEGRSPPSPGAAAAQGGLGNLWRVLPARALRWVGMGWLCSPV